MFSQTVEYALRAVVFLAERPDDRWPTQQIAESTRIPAGYLAKVLQNLAKGGVVEGQRGLHGGFVLSRPPEKISLHEVVQAVDPIQRIRQCPLRLPEHSKRLCPLHRHLDRALGEIEKSFRRSTIADLMTRDTFPG